MGGGREFGGGRRQGTVRDGNDLSMGSQKKKKKKDITARRTKTTKILSSCYIQHILLIRRREITDIERTEETDRPL